MRHREDVKSFAPAWTFALLGVDWQLLRFKASPSGQKIVRDGCGKSSRSHERASSLIQNATGSQGMKLSSGNRLLGAGTPRD